MAQFDQVQQALLGPGGSLAVRHDDEITRKLAMLVEGECDGLGPHKAARKFGFSKQRYFQLRTAFLEVGASALQSRKRGPKTHYRRTAEVVRQVIRHRFLDPEASVEVIAQKLTQSGWIISIRSVQRVIVGCSAPMRSSSTSVTCSIDSRCVCALPLPLRGREKQNPLPRVALRPPVGGLRSTRGYSPSPLWGEDGAMPVLGWNRAGTMNLNVRYGQMTMALVAQAVLHRLRRALGEPYALWDAGHLAKSLLAALEGDVRVSNNNIVVTYYNAPNVERLREHYEDLPDRLAAEQIDPHVPWLYGFELDFRFR